LLETARQKKDGPEDWLFLAMIHIRLGKAADAQGWLDKAAQWRDTVRRNGRVAGTAGAMSRSQLAQLDLLHREAVELFQE
jgi:hypothetical protein